MKRTYFVVPAVALVAGTPSGAQQVSGCAGYRAQVAMLRSEFPQRPLWDDVKIARASHSLTQLEISKRNLQTLTRQMNGSAYWSSNAAELGRSGEANIWSSSADKARNQIDKEKSKAKAWLADAGVSCARCTYTIAIAKARAAIELAISDRYAAARVAQQLGEYRKLMATAACTP